VRRSLIGWVKPSSKIEPSQLGTAGGEMGVVQQIEEAKPPLPLPSGNTSPDQTTDE
jgi:hypothetical protein